MHSTSPHGRWQRGAAAIEMAFMLPILFFAMAMIIDFGRFFFVEIQLTNAAREGARAAVVTDANVTGRITAAAPGIPGIDIAPITPCAGAGTQVTVTVTDPDFKWILIGPAVTMLGGAAPTLPSAKAEAVMRCEV